MTDKPPALARCPVCGEQHKVEQLDNGPAPPIQVLVCPKLAGTDHWHLVSERKR